MRRYYPAALVAALPLFVGCGGGGSSTPVATTTPIKLDLSWAARSRGIVTPASARSVVVFLQQGNPSTGGLAQFPAINRADDPAAYTQSYVSPTNVRPGPNLITLIFYTNKDGAGEVVGTASKAINLASDGTGIGEVLTVGKVLSVAIAGASALTVGQNTELGIAATDGNGASVAVSSGSATFSVLSGGDFITLTPDGKITAKAVGVARLSVSMDGKSSDPFSFSSRAPGTATAIIAAGQSVKLGESKKLDLSFTDASGTPITVDPSQITFETTAGGDVAGVALDGTLTGQKLGTIRLKVKIPGLESATTPVRVVPPGSFSVSLPAQQSVGISETKPLLLDVKDEAGTALPVGTEGVQFTVTRGSDVVALTAAGSATGVAAGYGVVTASVAGTTSAPQAVFVGSILTTATGLKYIEKLVGTGAATSNGKRATILYRGSLLNGTIFDPGQSPLTLRVGANPSESIVGFEEGIVSMKVGGKRLLIIPPALGYGASPRSSIPANSTLIFDVELSAVES